MSLLKIKFNISRPEYSWADKPVPAISSLPNWYKDMKPFANSDKLVITAGDSNQTLKRCVPFLDAMGAGYYIPMWADVQVSQTEYGSMFNWTAKYDVIQMHPLEQLVGVDVPVGYEAVPYKFVNHYVVKTPPGYSTLFISPINRSDLPFMSMGGVVDTDKHPLSVHFPFFIKAGFEGTIERGTPMIQAIPFKRDEWESEFGSIDNIDVHHEEFRSYLTRSYKKLGYWTRKIWQ